MTIEETAPSRAAAIRALEVEFGALLDRARRLLSENAERMSPHLQPGAYKVVARIARHGDVTLSSLAETLLADKGQLSRAVRELEDLGFVARTPDPADRRSNLLSLTPLGRERFEFARAPQQEALLTALDGWAVDEVEQLTRLLHAFTHGSRPTS